MAKKTKKTETNYCGLKVEAELENIVTEIPEVEEIQPQPPEQQEESSLEDIEETEEEIDEVQETAEPDGEFIPEPLIDPPTQLSLFGEEAKGLQDDKDELLTLNYKLLEIKKELDQYTGTVNYYKSIAKQKEKEAEQCESNISNILYEIKRKQNKIELENNKKEAETPEPEVLSEEDFITEKQSEDLEAIEDIPDLQEIQAEDEKLELEAVA